MIILLVRNPVILCKIFTVNSRYIHLDVCFSDTIAKQEASGYPAPARRREQLPAGIGRLVPREVPLQPRVERTVFETKTGS